MDKVLKWRRHARSGPRKDPLLYVGIPFCLPTSPDPYGVRLLPNEVYKGLSSSSRTSVSPGGRRALPLWGRERANVDYPPAILRHSGERQERLLWIRVEGQQVRMPLAQQRLDVLG